MSNKLSFSTYRPALALLAIAVTAACSPSNEARAAQDSAPPAATAPKADAAALDLALRQYGEMRQMASLDSRCQWLEPIARTALDASINERLAWYLGQGGDASAAEAQAEEQINKRKDEACKVLASQHLDKAIQLGTWQMRVSWALSAHGLLDQSAEDQWMKGKSKVEAARDSLQTAINTLSEKYEVSAENAASLTQQARLMLATRCSEAEKNMCPATDHSPAAKQYADIWIAQAEAYAAAMDKITDKVGTPPAM